MPDTFRSRLAHALARFVDTISFDSRTREFIDELNLKASGAGNVPPHPPSHPGGFIRGFQKRRMSIAEAYLRVAQASGNDGWRERLDALQTLVDESLHAKNVALPLNTARVQIEIVKQAIKHAHDRRRQLELMTDFSVASYGQDAVIRQLLNELSLMQVPEEDRPLSALDLGRDAQVHDNLSEGRKTPSQVILDAFIKGMSSLTIAHYDLSNRNAVREALEAGRILGIDVRLGLEFSVGPARRRRYYMYAPPAAPDADALFLFFSQHAEFLDPFLAGLETNARKRKEVVAGILEEFNRNHLPKINEGYPDGSCFTLRPVTMERLDRLVHGQYSRIHLSSLLYDEILRVFRRRVLHLKTQYEVSRRFAERERLTRWEIERMGEAYRTVRERYERFTAEELRERYLPDKIIRDYDSAFADERSILPNLRACGGRIVYLHPLAQGVTGAVETMVRHHDLIDEVEAINMYDNSHRNPNDVLLLGRFLDLVNNDTAEELRRFADEWRCNLTPEEIERASRRCRERPIVPVASSDSTGRDPKVPGMGFIRASQVPAKSRATFKSHHFCLPKPLSTLILNKGRRPAAPPANPDDELIFSLGKGAGHRPNPVGDERDVELLTPRRIWRYGNPHVKKSVRVAIGFLPALWWFGAPFYPLLWFAITFFRNILVDLVAATGIDPRRWKIRHINMVNATQSLFWTGFSVPILGLVKLGFDRYCPLDPAGQAFEWTKFLFICLANGSYIALHNTWRGFEPKVIRANFFRSVFAWPFASLFAPVGNGLGIESIVQAKFWSDAVAAVIEGTGRYVQRMLLGRRDLREILPKVTSGRRDERHAAMLDVLFVWAEKQRGRTSLQEILLHRYGLLDRLRIRLGIGDPARDETREAIAWREALMKTFAADGAMTSLSQYALEHYRDGEAVCLTDLLCNHFADFVVWLRELDAQAVKLGLVPGAPKKDNLYF